MPMNRSPGPERKPVQNFSLNHDAICYEDLQLVAFLVGVWSVDGWLTPKRWSAAS